VQSTLKGLTLETGTWGTAVRAWGFLERLSRRVERRFSGLKKRAAEKKYVKFLKNVVIWNGTIGQNN